MASAQVYTWRTAAVGVWAMAIVSWAAQAWSLDWPSLLSLRPWRVAAPLLGAETLGLVVLLGLACSPAALIHISLLRVSEPRPLLPSNSSGPAATLSRALGRLRTATEFLQCCIFIGTSMLSGSVFLEAFVLLRAKGSAPGEPSAPLVLLGRARNA